MTSPRRGIESLVSIAGDRIDLSAIAEPPAWTRDAVCSSVDLDIFFPQKGESTKPAKRVCLACPVRSECLAYAVERKERFGIWGGVSERERRRMERAA